MSPEALAVALGLFSAVTLAAANYSVKAGGDILMARSLLQLSASLITLPLAFFVAPPDAATLAALAVAVPVHFAYQLVLIGALKHGDLSLVFPVMRGSAPLLTGIAAYFLLGEQLTLIGSLGLVLATVAVIAFALPPKGTGLRSHPDGRALLFAAATAVGIALYNVADARGVRIAPDPLTYVVWLFLFDCLGITPLAIWRRRGRWLAGAKEKWRYGLAGGALSVVSYGAVLYAFTLVEAAKVSAVRETSVVFAALMGVIWLKEGLGPRRIVAALTLAAGLAILQFAG